MSKTTYPRIVTGLLLIGISMACTLPFTQIAESETETPVPTANPMGTETPVPTASPTETPALSPAPNEFMVSDTAIPEFAPFCWPRSESVATPFQCQVPIAEQSSAFCSSKVPYNMILINEGSTYETLTEDFECSDAGKKDGKQVLTCTGPVALAFELRVCDPACGIPTFQPGTTRCPQYYNYNNSQKCCEQKPFPDDQNCVVLELQTKGCVVDCSAITEEGICYKYAYACVWDDKNSLCLQINR